MTLGLPCASGLFSTLQEALRRPSQRRVCFTPAVHDFLDDFRALTSTISDRPTRIAELLPRAHSKSGASDALGVGVGGVHFIPPDGTIQPLLWHQPLPSNITDCLITNDNLSGTITMNDFEIAACVARQDAIAQYDGIRSLTAQNFHDNITAVYWQHKSSATTMKGAAYFIHLQAFQQRFCRYVP